MLYKFNKEKLMYEKINKVKLFTRPIAFTALVVAIMSFAFERKVDIPAEQKLIVLQEYNSFSEDKLVEKIASFNFRFPHIVLAQAKLESGNFKSFLFKENNNLFGMKIAKSRITLATEEDHGHAVYSSWMESVTDYALYYSAYLRNIRSEQEYYQFLAQNYAEDVSYVQKIKELVQKENLKSKF